MHLFNDKKSQKEYLYFGDCTTAKKIRFFTFEGDTIKTISLKSVTNDGEEIDDISVISLDTILALTLYTNKIYCIDGKGHCIKKIYIDSLLPKDSYKYEFHSSIYKDFYENEK